MVNEINLKNIKLKWSDRAKFYTTLEQDVILQAFLDNLIHYTKIGADIEWNSIPYTVNVRNRHDRTFGTSIFIKELPYKWKAIQLNIYIGIIFMEALNPNTRIVKNDIKDLLEMKSYPHNKNEGVSFYNQKIIALSFVSEKSGFAHTWWQYHHHLRRALNALFKGKLSEYSNYMRMMGFKGLPHDLDFKFKKNEPFIRSIYRDNYSIQETLDIYNSKNFWLNRLITAIRKANKVK